MEENNMLKNSQTINKCMATSKIIDVIISQTSGEPIVTFASPSSPNEIYSKEFILDEKTGNAYYKTMRKTILIADFQQNKICWMKKPM